MAKGLDANTDCSGLIPCLKQNGIEFIARYYGRTKHHPLTQQEAKTISAAGMHVVAVWESGNPTSADYFSHVQGVADGHDAYIYAHTKIGQPTESPIYFAVDYDATHADVNGVVTSYFQGIHEGFDKARGNAPAYPVGVYGSGLTCTHLLHVKMVTFTWLSEFDRLRRLCRVQRLEHQATCLPDQNLRTEHRRYRHR